MDVGGGGRCDDSSVESCGLDGSPSFLAMLVEEGVGEQGSVYDGVYESVSTGGCEYSSEDVVPRNRRPFELTRVPRPSSLFPPLPSSVEDPGRVTFTRAEVRAMVAERVSGSPAAAAVAARAASWASSGSSARSEVASGHSPWDAVPPKLTPVQLPDWVSSFGSRSGALQRMLAPGLFSAYPIRPSTVLGGVQ